MKSLILAAFAAVSLVLGGCATAEKAHMLEQRVEQAEKVIDAGQRDLANVRTEAVRKITEAENRLSALEKRPVPAPQAPVLSTQQVEAIAKAEAAKAATAAFAAGKVTDASTLATKKDLEASVKRLTADIAGITPAAAPPADPPPAKFVGVLENWPAYPHLAGAYLSNGYAELAPADRAAWVAELKAANTDPKFGCWVDSVIK
jgi:TolA-binding protein